MQVTLVGDFAENVKITNILALQHVWKMETQSICAFDLCVTYEYSQ